MSNDDEKRGNGPELQLQSYGDEETPPVSRRQDPSSSETLGRAIELRERILDNVLEDHTLRLSRIEEKLDALAAVDKLRTKLFVDLAKDSVRNSEELVLISSQLKAIADHLGVPLPRPAEPEGT